MRQAPTACTPVDLSVDALDARAQRIAASMGTGFDGWATHAAALVPRLHGQSNEMVRATFNLDDARTLLALEHGMTDYRSLQERIDLLATGSESSTFRLILAAVAESNAHLIGNLIEAEPDVMSELGTFGRDLMWWAGWWATSELSLPSVAPGVGAFDVLDVLLAFGGDPGTSDFQGWTPLHCAAYSGNDALVDWLLAAGADPAPTCHGEGGATPVNFALFYAHPETARRMVSAMDSAPTLRIAAGVDDVAAVHGWFGSDGSLRPGAGADMSFCRPIPQFPPRSVEVTDQLVIDEALSWAARSGQVAAMEALVDHGADVDANAFRGTPLLWAIYADRVEAAVWLLDHGADPDLRHDFGGVDHGAAATAMHLAAQYSSVRCLEVLLDRGADATIRDASWNSTPQGWAEHADQRLSLEVFASHSG